MGAYCILEIGNARNRNARARRIYVTVLKRVETPLIASGSFAAFGVADIATQ
jgi:hypothetical protein